MTADLDLGFIHRFLPAAERGATTLLLLHGTGANEDQLIGLGRVLSPAANLLSPRGNVVESGMPRFFRRLAPGVFDLDDLVARTHELADFVAGSVRAYRIDSARICAVGYSNGANIAASLLLLRPDVLRAAILFRPMVPLQPEGNPRLDRVPVLIAAGRRDELVPPQETEKLTDLLRRSGADVTLRWSDGGHPLADDEVEAATEWLAALEGG